MSEANLSFRYILFSCSNFLAAFGGGMILGKGIGVIVNPLIPGSSVLAFLIGTILGLVFLELLPRSKIIFKWFAFFCAFTSILLLWIFKNYSINGKISNSAALFFFAFLIIRFGFWFYSRVSRTAEAAGEKQRIAWVEFGYFTGVIIGLLIWEIFNVNVNFDTALLIDIGLQFSVGLIDLFASHHWKITEPSHIQFKEKTSKDINDNTNDKLNCFDSFHTRGKPREINFKDWYWRLTSAVIFLTAGIQAIIFNLSYHVSEQFGITILAFFYIGVAIAAAIYSKYKICLEWIPIRDKDTGIATICHNALKQHKGLSFLLLSTISMCCVITAITNSFSHSFAKKIIVLTLISIAAFIYEILALAILDRISLENNANKHFFVMRAYGLMGVGAAVILIMLGFLQNSLLNLFLIVSLCLIGSTIAMRKRYS